MKKMKQRKKLYGWVAILFFEILYFFHRYYYFCDKFFSLSCLGKKDDTIVVLSWQNMTHTTCLAFIFVGPVWHITTKLISSLKYRRHETDLLPYFLSPPILDNRRIEKRIVISIIDDEQYEHLEYLIHQTMYVLQREPIGTPRFSVVSARAPVNVDSTNIQVIRDWESLQQLGDLQGVYWAHWSELKTYFNIHKQRLCYKLLYAPGEPELQSLQHNLRNYFRTRHFMYFTFDKKLVNVELILYGIRGRHFMIPIVKNEKLWKPMLNRMITAGCMYRCTKIIMMIPQTAHETDSHVYNILRNSGIPMQAALRPKVKPQTLPQDVTIL